MSLLQMPAACATTDSWTCAAVYHATGNETLARLAAWAIGKPLAILVILLGAALVRWVAVRTIDRLVNRAEHGVVVPRRFTLFRGHDPGRMSRPRSHPDRRAQRARTLGSLLKSITTALVFGVAIVMALAEVGANIAPILASAGVVGLAIGFGAQTLVKDFLSGVALMVEDQYGVGDIINLGDISGTVEGIGLRVTRLRDVDGTVWYVRNGEILKVGNQSQNWARTVLDIAVGYKEDLGHVQQVLREVAHAVWEDPQFDGAVIEEPEVWGVQSLDPESVVVRVTLKTAPAEQWRVAREMRARIKARFDREGIEIPLPQRVVWHRQGDDQVAAE
jgi:small-conductance mechanosensitive channel